MSKYKQETGQEKSNGDSGIKADAKRAAIQSLRKTMGKLGGQSLDESLQQKFAHGGIIAKVSAKDPKSLKKGLMKAAEIVEEKEEMMEDHMSDDMPDLDDMSADELRAYIKKNY